MELEIVQKYLDKEIDPKLRELWVSFYEEMIVHTRGVMPEKLLKIARPNEPKEILDYRISIFQKITQDPILKALNSTYHLVKQSDYKIIAGDITKEYIATHRFDSVVSINKQTITDLIFKTFLQLGVEDANGLLIALPINTYDSTLPPLEAYGQPTTERVDVAIQYLNSDEIEYIDDKILIYESGEAMVGDVEGDIYTIITDTDIWINTPVRLDSNNKLIYELSLWYNHNLGFVPYRVLGGLETIRTIKKGRKTKSYKLFDTYFTAYNSWANKAITTSSDFDAVRMRFSFPIEERLSTECVACRGKGQVMLGDCMDNKCNHERGMCNVGPCSACHGRGIVPDLSPYSVIVRPAPSSLDGQTANDSPSVRFYAPPFEAVGINKDIWFEMMDKMEQSISVYQSNNTQSGVAKEYDLEQKRDFIAVIGDNLMNLLEFSLQCIAGYLQDPEPVKVIKPTKYEIRSKDDVLSEIIKVGTISKDLVKSLSDEYVDKEYDDVEKRAMKMLINNDIYYGYTLDELGKLKAMQLLSNDAFDFHMQGYKILTSLLEIDSNWNKTDQELINDANTQIIRTISTGI